MALCYYYVYGAIIKKINNIWSVKKKSNKLNLNPLYKEFRTFTLYDFWSSNFTNQKAQGNRVLACELQGYWTIQAESVHILKPCIDISLLIF